MVNDWKPIIMVAVLMLSGLILQSEGGGNDDEFNFNEERSVSNMIGETTSPGPTRADLNPAPRIEELKYAAIGRPEFEDELKPLLDWKTQKGVKARFFSLEDVKAGYGGEGIDTAQCVRDFLKSLKQRNPSLEWVLLAGDGEDIPPRDVFVNGSAEIDPDDPDNYVATDMYYAGLDLVREDGDWDLNNNGIYGEDYLIEDKKFEEKDFNADVFVGRFPGSTEEEMEIMVQKQLSYELDPPPGSWSNSMLLAGSLMDAPNDPINYQAYKDNAYELVLKVEADLPDHVTPFHLVDYPQIEYGGYNIMFDTLNRSSFESYYEAGFSSVLIACHGDPFNGNCTNYKGDGGGGLSYIRDYEDHFTYEMAGTIQNGERLPLVYISSCASTPFQEEDDTNMERLLTNPDGGAIALIGATVDTYRGEFRPNPDDPNSTYSFGNWWLAEEFFNLLHSGTVRPGEALYTQKWNYRLHLLYDLGKTVDIDQYSKIFNIDTLAYNLMGDPEGPLWLDDPKEMRVLIPDEFDHEEGFDISVVDSLNGWPIQGALVTLTDPDDPEIYLSGRTGAEGTVTLNPPLSDLGELKVVVTMDGFVPEIGSIEAVSTWDIEIDQDISFIPDPPVYGEPFKAVFTIRNNGDHDVDNLYLLWSWFEEGQPLDDNFSLRSGMNVTKEKEIIWSNDDLSTLTAWIVIVPEKLESSTLNNIAVKDFTVNEPLIMNLDKEIRIEEDRSFSSLHGKWLDLIDLRWVVDIDGPNPISVEGEVVEGHEENITLTQDEDDQSFDIIPAKDWSGVAEIKFTATDGSKSFSGIVMVKVMEIQDQPRFSRIPTQVNGSEDRTNNFTIELYDVDSEDLNLTTSSNWVKIEKDQSGHTSIFTIEITPTEMFIGENLLGFTASDGMTDDVNQTISVYVRSTNDPPQIVDLPSLIIVTKGDDLEIDLLIEDPDGDNLWSITRSWEFGTVTDNNTVFTMIIPDEAIIGDHELTITVDDGKEDGVTEQVITIRIKKEKREDYSLVLVVLISLIVSFLLIYGVLLKVQERKQKKMLDSVGTNAPLEARPLTEKDFNKRKRNKKDDGIPMPPAPLEVEGALAREVTKEEDEDEPKPVEQDLESDIDDILTEMFS